MKGTEKLVVLSPDFLKRITGGRNGQYAHTDLPDEPDAKETGHTDLPDGWLTRPTL